MPPAKVTCEQVQIGAHLSDAASYVGRDSQKGRTYGWLTARLRCRQGGMAAKGRHSSVPGLQVLPRCQRLARQQLHARG